MSINRIRKVLAAFALLAGVLALSAPEAVQAANKVQDAKKYTQVLKTTKNSKEKILALNELGDLGRLMKSLVTDALPDMIAAMKDSDAGVRAAAATAVGKCDPDSQGVEGLVGLLKSDKDDAVKIAAAKGLAAAGPSAKSALPTLREIAKNEDKKSKLGKAAQDASRAINMKKN